jgi:hypothetical protein
MCEESFDRFATANASSDLHLKGALSENVAQQLVVRASSGCRIEVNKMQSAETVGCPAPGDAGRIVEANALVRVRPPNELNTRAVTQVNRRNRDHRLTESRKARMNRTPAPELFSGWNCTPTVLPRRRAAGNRSSSCVVHAMTVSLNVGRQT